MNKYIFTALMLVMSPVLHKTFAQIENLVIVPEEPKAAIANPFWIDKDDVYIVDIICPSNIYTGYTNEKLLYAFFDGHAIGLPVSRIKNNKYRGYTLKLPSYDSIFIEARHLESYKKTCDSCCLRDGKLYSKGVELTMDDYFPLPYYSDTITISCCAVINDDTKEICWYKLYTGLTLSENMGFYYLCNRPSSRYIYPFDWYNCTSGVNQTPFNFENCFYKHYHLLPGKDTISTFSKPKNVEIMTPDGIINVTVTSRPYARWHHLDGVFEVTNVYNTRKENHVTHDRYVYIPEVMFLPALDDKFLIDSINGKTLKDFMRERNSRQPTTDK